MTPKLPNVHNPDQCDYCDAPATTRGAGVKTCDACAVAWTPASASAAPDCTGHTPHDWRVLWLYHCRSAEIQAGNMEDSTYRHLTNQMPMLAGAGAPAVMLTDPDDPDDSPREYRYSAEQVANAVLLAHATHAPHTCTDPACPGNLNARKLAAYPALRTALLRMLRAYRTSRSKGVWPNDVENEAHDALAAAPE